MLKHALLTMILSAAATTAWAADGPSWYPEGCLTIDSCAPVHNVAWVAPAGGDSPHLVVWSVFGRAIVQWNFPVAVSHDRRIHVCMRYDPFGQLEVTCLLVPARIF